ncbi:hypothetical protein LZ30DRAFT_763341 [Colletotrichum cereale]|nr:hypothetical protein LZ30DRAFT_763341 [Colletotrichum cereale]
MQDFTSKVVFIAGGSSGLGKPIAEVLAARRRADLLKLALSSKQEINAVTLDLLDAAQVNEAFRKQPRLPDALYCVADGCVSQLGFFTDLTSQQLEECMQNNYLTRKRKTRQLIFVSSASALCNVPGYVAYADTLREEDAIYSTPTCQYKVHCAFPKTFMTDAFIDEQETKPELTKRIESSDGPLEKLKTRIPSAEYIAEYIVARVVKGDFAVVSDFYTEVLWSNMLGSSPKRGLGFVDSVLGLLSGFLVWTVLSISWDSLRQSS